MFGQEIMKTNHLTNLDKADCKKFMGKIVKGPWVPTFEAAVDTCFDMIPEHAPILQKKYNFPKEKCDAKYVFFLECLRLKAFNVSITRV
jgi:hypothetical protein